MKEGIVQTEDSKKAFYEFVNTPAGPSRRGTALRGKMEPEQPDRSGRSREGRGRMNKRRHRPQQFDVFQTKLPDGSLIYIVRTYEEWERARARLEDAMGVTNVLGLDVEFLMGGQHMPTENKMMSDSKNGDPMEYQRLLNVSQGKDPLLQLAARGVAVLIRLCYFKVLPQSLHDLMLDRMIIKVGVEIVEDVRRLKSHWKLRVNSSLDLRYACYSCEFFKKHHSQSASLKSIGKFFNQSISEKKPEFRLVCGNWAAPALSFEQIEYAAQDALAAVGSYITLVTEHFETKLKPEEERFWRYFRTRKFGAHLNRPYADSCARKVGAGKGKLSRKPVENEFRSDSDVDYDFESEKNRQADLLPIPKMVWFHINKDDKRNYRKASAKEEVKEPLKVKYPDFMLNKDTETPTSFKVQGHRETGGLSRVKDESKDPEEEPEIVINQVKQPHIKPVNERKEAEEVKEEVKSGKEESQEARRRAGGCEKRKEGENSNQSDGSPGMEDLTAEQLQSLSLNNSGAPGDITDDELSEGEIADEGRKRKGGDRKLPSKLIEGPLGIEQELIEWAEAAKIKTFTMTVKEKPVAGSIVQQSQRFRLRVTFETDESSDE